jgi:hypothetical protein
MTGTPIGQVSITCPDCKGEFLAGITVDPLPQDSPGAMARVRVRTDLAVQRFTEHVVSAPEQHPTFIQPAV